MSGPVEPPAGGEGPQQAGGQPVSAQPATVEQNRGAVDESEAEQEREDAGEKPQHAAREAVSPTPVGSDPFRLRPRQPQVMRLSRRAVAIIGLALGLGIGGSLIWALKTSAPKVATNLYDTASAARPGILSGAPADYSQTPHLGKPLIGDLGRPMLSVLRRRNEALGNNADGQSASPQSANGPTPLQAAAMERRQRVLQESDAARSSQLFLGNAGNARSNSSGAGEATMVGASPAAGQANPALSALATPAAGSQASKRSFMETKAGQSVVSSEAVTAITSPYVLQAGSIIPAALITGIRSDLPGQITAQVTQNVYDSPTGRLLLIPQGARLIGEYDSQVAAGQNRVLLAWDRLILPDGRSIHLERQPGADAAGMAGLQDRTNYHWGNMLKAALVSTLLGMGTQLVTQGDSALVQALRYGMQDSINQTGRQLVQREIGVAPTLTVRPGYPLRVIVTRDLVIEIASKEK